MVGQPVFPPGERPRPSSCAENRFAGEGGSLDPSFRAAAGPVVALGHQQLGEKPAIRHLITGCCFGKFWELGSDGGQPQHAARLVDGSIRSLFRQPAVAFERSHGLSPSTAERSVGRLGRSSWS